MIILYSKYEHPSFFLLSHLFTNSIHSTLREIHSRKGTSQYGGRDNTVGRATRYGLRVRGSNLSGARFPISVQTDHEISGLLFKSWRPWRKYVQSYFQLRFGNWVVMSRSFEVEGLDSSRFHWSTWRHLSRLTRIVWLCSGKR
jgi:hypothetical protein